MIDTLVREARFGRPGTLRAPVFQRTGITAEQVRRAPPWSEVRPAVCAMAQAYPLAAFNAAFDFGFLRARGVVPRRELPCLMRAAAKACQIPRAGARRAYKWPTLGEAWACLFPGVSYAQQHRAYDDCVHEARILAELVRRKNFFR